MSSSLVDQSSGDEDLDVAGLVSSPEKKRKKNLQGQVAEVELTEGKRSIGGIERKQFVALGSSVEQIETPGSGWSSALDSPQKKRATLQGKGKPAKKKSNTIISVYSDKYIYIGLWLSLLFLGWASAKGWCAAGIPSDCQTKGEWTSAGVLNSLVAMFSYGCVMAWMCNLTNRSRVRALYSRKMWWYYAVYFTTIVVFGALGNIRFLQFSISGGASIGAGGWIVLSIAGVAVLFLVGLHFKHAHKKHSSIEFRIYTASRISVLLFYATLIAFASFSENYGTHVHHYLIGFSIALFCQFNTTFSWLLLAVASAIFVQGLGAYEFAPIFEKVLSCRHVVNKEQGLPEPLSTIMFISSKTATIDICAFDATTNVSSVQLNGESWKSVTDYSL